MNTILTNIDYSRLKNLSKKELIALLLSNHKTIHLKKKLKSALIAPILHNTLNSLKEGFVIVDKQGTYLFINKEAEKLLKKSSENLLGKKMWEEFPEKQGDEFYDKFQKSIKEDISLNFKSYYKEWGKWYANRIIPSKNAISMFFRDITKEEKEDKNKTEAYKFLQESEYVSFIWLNKPNWPVKYVSENVEKLLGYTTNDFISNGLKYYDIVHPKDVLNLKKIAEQQISNNQTNVTYPPYRIIKKNGQTIWVSESNILHKNDKDEVTSYRGIIKDVTEQQKLKYSFDLITNSTAHFIGKEFLDTICLELTKCLESDLTFIGFNTPNTTQIHTISASNRTSILDNFKYDTLGAPCKTAISCNVTCIPKDVAILFPEDKFLRDHQFEGYIGVALLDKNQTPIGIIVSLFKNPIDDEEFTKTIIQIFSTRISVEIQSTISKKEALQNQNEAWGLFQDSVSAIWIQDLSKVKLYFNDLKQTGVTDFNSYIQDNPQELQKITALIVLKKVNKKSLKLFEINNANLSQESLSKYLTQKSVPATINCLNSIFNNKTNCSYEFPMRINGKEKTIIIDVVIPEFSKINFKNILFSFNDITEQRITENLLKENKKKLQDQLDNTPLAAITWDLDFNCLSWNNSAERIFGYTSKEALGKGFHSLMNYRDNKKYKNKLLIDLLKDTNLQYTLQTRTKEGKQITTRWHVVTLKNASNKVIGSASLIQDITKEVEANRKIELSEKRYRDLFKKSNDPVLIFSDDIIVDCNKAALKTLGYSDKNHILQKEVKHISPKYQANGKQSKKLVVKNHKKAREIGKHHFEWNLKRKDGSIFPVEISITSIETSYGNNILHAIFRDITERKTHEFELNKALDKAKQSDTLKSAFLANMSHEIRTPMNGIIGFSELFLEPNLSDKDREYYANIVIKSSKQLLNIVNNILDISQIEAGMVHVKKEAVDLNEVLSSTKNFFLGKANEKKITLRIACEQDKNPIIESDLSKIQQILNNLVSNALKFTEKGYIEIGYSLESDTIQFYIKDTGIGIKGANKEKIFSRFTQADINISTKFGGNGLGLSISQKLVHLLGGKIWFESEYQKGTKFSFTIPYIKKDIKGIVKKDTEKALKEMINTTDTKTILVADDEIFNIMFVKEVFSNGKFNILEATNGKEAVALCNKYHHKIDLILMDVKMPIMNGLEATKIIKEKHPHLPIIALSAYAMESDISKALSYGCDGTISKPVNKKTLLDTFNKYTSNH